MLDAEHQHTIRTLRTCGGNGVVTDSGTARVAEQTSTYHCGRYGGCSRHTDRKCVSIAGEPTKVHWFDRGCARAVPLSHSLASPRRTFVCVAFARRAFARRDLRFLARLAGDQRARHEAPRCRLNSLGPVLARSR